MLKPTEIRHFHLFAGHGGIDRQDVIVSTDVRTRVDSLPRSGEPEPKGHCTAVYWEDRKGHRRVIAIDQYDKVAGNLAAMRAIERRGGAAILERAFTGFTALLAPSATRDCWQPPGVSKDSRRGEITAAYRRLRSLRHPDRSGGAAAFGEVEQAHQEATQ